MFPGIFERSTGISCAFFLVEEDFVLFCCFELVGNCSFIYSLYPLEMRLWQYLEAEVGISTQFTAVHELMCKIHIRRLPEPTCCLDATCFQMGWLWRGPKFSGGRSSLCRCVYGQCEVV